MGEYREIEGDLVLLAQQGNFDVVAQGNNCFCVQGAGLAPQFVKAFETDKFRLEGQKFAGSINKLGMIDYEPKWVNDGVAHPVLLGQTPNLYVVCCYTQYGFGSNHKEGTSHPLSYPALILCLQKINHTFPGKHIGLPLIGCGLAGGNWEDVKGLIQKNLNNMKVTIVHYKPETNDTGTTNVQEVDNGSNWQGISSTI